LRFVPVAFSLNAGSPSLFTGIPKRLILKIETPAFAPNANLCSPPKSKVYEKSALTFCSFTGPI
jgi:hypothetical protein